MSIIEVPFALRHHCWFCGEPNACVFSFPQNSFSPFKTIILDCPHPTLSVPSCSECYRVAMRALSKFELNSIWAIQAQVKSFLLKHYQKDLAIGLNWTEAELANSEFDDGNFLGFKKNAWFMYEVAKARVNYQGCALTVDGIEIEFTEYQHNFNFDGVLYPSINDAVKHYCQAYSLDEGYFKQVLFAYDKLKRGNIESNKPCFSQTVRFCRILINATPDEKKSAFLALTVKEVS
ncbi:MAG: hypothetical protein OCD00_17960 [Colwellia sp.]